MVKDERSWTERHDAYWEAEGREAAKEEKEMASAEVEASKG